MLLRACLLLGVAWESSALRTLHAATPEAALAACGLTFETRTGLAFDAMELRLRTTLERLPESERQLQAAIEAAGAALREQQTLAAALRDTQRRIEELDRQTAAAGGAAKTAPAAQTLRAQLAAQAEAARARLADPQQPASYAAVRARLANWSEARSALAVALLTVLSDEQGLAARYAEHQADPAVRTALAKLGAKARLGPARDYRRDVLHWHKQQDRILAAPLPYFERRGKKFASLIGNERGSFTCHWSESGDESSWLPASIAQRLGVAPLPDAPPVMLTLPDGAVVPARPAVLETLRVGPVLVKRTPVLLLPADREEWGARLGGAAIPGHLPRFDPATMTVRLAAVQGG